MRLLSRTPTDFFAKSEIWIVHSDSIDETFRLCITAPPLPLAEGTRAGAIYTTDAGIMAGWATSTVIGSVMEASVPPSFTISVGYPIDCTPPETVKRGRELTPNAYPPMDALLGSLQGEGKTVPSGGADNYLAFLIDELRPALNEAFAIDADDATLCGASLGGLFTLHAMLSRPEAFWRYLAICPAFWWHDKVVLRAAQTATKARSAPDARLYMCAGEFESLAHQRATVETLPQEMRDRLPPEILVADMHGDMFEMERTLATWGAALAVRAAVYPEEGHMSVPAAGLSRGLRWLFGSLTR